jgi:ABC-type phosphate transport system substrate-binding protein
MLRIILLFLILTLVLPKELVVVGNSHFPKDRLTISELRAIFLNKRETIHSEKMLVMNYHFNHFLRRCFEKNILHKSQSNLERYWRRAYYKGKRPPKIIKSVEMLFLYLENVNPSIGYSERSSIKNMNIKILYSISCTE